MDGKVSFDEFKTSYTQVICQGQVRSAEDWRQLSLSTWVHSLPGLLDPAQVLQTLVGEELTLVDLKELNETDLEKMGFKKGTRIKLLREIQKLSGAASIAPAAASDAQPVPASEPDGAPAQPEGETTKAQEEPPPAPRDAEAANEVDADAREARAQAEALAQAEAAAQTKAKAAEADARTNDAREQAEVEAQKDAPVQAKAEAQQAQDAPPAPETNTPAPPATSEVKEPPASQSDADAPAQREQGQEAPAAEAPPAADKQAPGANEPAAQSEAEAPVQAQGPHADAPDANQPPTTTERVEEPPVPQSDAAAAEETVVVRKPKLTAGFNKDGAGLPSTLTCYICGEGFGTASVNIHQKSCIRKHARQVDLMVAEAPAKRRPAILQKNPPPVSVEEAALPPNPKQGNHAGFDAYNERAEEVLAAHCELCDLCRCEQQKRGSAQREEEERKRREAEEAERRRKEAEEA
eukprot:CAMPEP_0114562512 /NCGR_PEP_ID=MMETSP0114-20121206/12569_1 /TAXON_ID=31324 /ORGANISM="Goniomonas sp, Strain m" /LENGTH=464 /DNA_ID=CAMNT_0001748203 /DNA_START=102 /DNA_END=1492 /DNA_ORIENTATION=+